MTVSVTRLQTFFGGLDALPLIRVMAKEEFPGEIAVVSSFGADAVVLLALVAEVDPTIPVLFLETEKHFPETLDYVNEVIHCLGLKDVRMLRPDPNLVNNIDKQGDLWSYQPNRCCWLRKVEPLDREIARSGLRALITGRKRFQTKDREDMDSIEIDEKGIFKINPQFSWTKDDVTREMEKRNLPKHPLVDKGYLSIGCAPCTRPVKSGEDERAGRWAHTAGFPGGEQKQECGLHVPQDADWSV
ncbi:MAG: phosphoadenylyl-sulfate reductase [Alphaproteobacteria bacterium]|nr:phosphoadenylyl-sulfate reductase [Alphaproteobacteria bacterium]